LSFMTVRTRAMSRRVLRSWLVLVSCWVAICMRSEKGAFSRSPSSFCSASWSLSRSSLAFIFLPLRWPGASGADHAGDEGRRDRQLGGRQRERFAGQLLVHAVHLVQHLARLDLRDVVLDIALAVAHADFGRLPRDRLVGEDPDPDAAATLDVTGHRSPGRLDLAGGQPAAAGGLQAELAERDRSASRRETLVAALLFLTVFASSGLQHRSLLVRGHGAHSVAFLFAVGRRTASRHLAHALDRSLRGVALACRRRGCLAVGTT